MEKERLQEMQCSGYHKTMTYIFVENTLKTIMQEEITWEMANQLRDTAMR
jgi:hypothetical protein